MASHRTFPPVGPFLAALRPRKASLAALCLPYWPSWASAICSARVILVSPCSRPRHPKAAQPRLLSVRRTAPQGARADAHCFWLFASGNSSRRAQTSSKHVGRICGVKSTHRSCGTWPDRAPPRVAGLPAPPAGGGAGRHASAWGAAGPANRPNFRCTAVAAR